MRHSSKTTSRVALSAVFFLGFTANVWANQLPAGVICTGEHRTGGNICYDGCSKNGSPISGHWGTDSLWHDGLCAGIVVQQSPAPVVKDAGLKGTNTTKKGEAAPAN